MADTRLKRAREAERWLSGEYVVDEVFEDGRIVLRPDTTAAPIRERAGLEPVIDDEFERAFGHLPGDSEG